MNIRILALLLSVILIYSCSDDDPGVLDFSKEVANNIYFAQTHVQKPSDDYFKLISNSAVLIKIQLTSPSTNLSPVVTASLTLNANVETITLKGPDNLPPSFNGDPGQINHMFDDSFTAVIPKEWVQPGLSIEVQVEGEGESIVLDELEIGAPNKLIMTMFDISYFSSSPGDYPSGWDKELANKLPVSSMELRRVLNIVFPELTVPPRAGLPAARIKSKQDYTNITGANFDGEQATAAQWNSALKAAAGTGGRYSLFYTNIYGVAAGGQAGGFSGVGNGKNHGILLHELGHALSLPHWGNKADYPYRNEMFGIPAPDVFNGVHVGPTWAFDMDKQAFIPPTVQANAVGGTPGTYKKDPMQGGGNGDQEPEFLMRHFSDYSVNQIRNYLEGHVVVWNEGLSSYAAWDDASRAYTKKMDNNGVKFATERDTEVISVMAGVSSATDQANIVYPPVGPYTSGLIEVFDPNVAADRTKADQVFCPDGGCDVSLKIIQGGTSKTVMLAIAIDKGIGPLDAASFRTRAVNFPASGGDVSKIELLLTPNAEKDGLPANPTVLFQWNK